MRVALDGDGEGAAQAQVGHLEQGMVWMGPFLHQQVLGLQVAVHDTMSVHVGYALEQLVHHALL